MVYSAEQAIREVHGDEPDADPSAPTRQRVARSILEHGPSTAAELATRLGLTAAGVRRHLDGLAEQGLLTSREQRVYGARGRGRPARVFVLTDAGRDSFGAGYDDLAVQALEFLAETAGPEAVGRFAQARFAGLEEHFRQRARRGRDGRDAVGDPGQDALGGGVRGVAAARRRRGAAVPAPLPGRPRRGTFPAAVRGRDGGVLAPARRARPAAGDDRARRRRLHDPHPANPLDTDRARRAHRTDVTPGNRNIRLRHRLEPRDGTTDAGPDHEEHAT